ncbi:MAG: hypothetical protein ACWA6X_11500 [Bauldia sp.]
MDEFTFHLTIGDEAGPDEPPRFFASAADAIAAAQQRVEALVAELRAEDDDAPVRIAVATAEGFVVGVIDSEFLAESASYGRRFSR